MRSVQSGYAKRLTMLVIGSFRSRLARTGIFNRSSSRQGGACICLQFPLESEFTITEFDVHGWVLDHVNCDTSGVSLTEFRHGVILTCQSDGGGGECDFVNVPLPIRSAIPTLSEWGMLAAAAGLGLIGLFFAVRRRKAVA